MARRLMVVDQPSGLEQAASSRMVGRLRRRSPLAPGLVVVANAARLGARASSRVVGRLLSGHLVSGSLVVPILPELGPTASSGMVGRLRAEPGRFHAAGVVSRRMVVDPAAT